MRLLPCLVVAVLILSGCAKKSDSSSDRSPEQNATSTGNNSVDQAAPPKAGKFFRVSLASRQNPTLQQWCMDMSDLDDEEIAQLKGSLADSMQDHKDVVTTMANQACDEKLFKFRCDKDEMTDKHPSHVRTYFIKNFGNQSQDKIARECAADDGTFHTL